MIRSELQSPGKAAGVAAGMPQVQEHTWSAKQVQLSPSAGCPGACAAAAAATQRCSPAHLPCSRFTPPRSSLGPLSPAYMPPCVRAEGWAALPRDVLGPMLRLVAEEAQAAGPLTLPAAQALLAALSPCRHWRAVALEEVSSSDSSMPGCCCNGARGYTCRLQHERHAGTPTCRQHLPP